MIENLHSKPSHEVEASVEDSIAIALEAVLHRLLVGGAIVSVVGILISLAGLNPFSIFFYTILAGFLFALSIVHSWSLRKRGAFLLGVLYLGAVVSLLRWGISGPGGIFLVVLPPLSILLFGEKATLPSVFASAFTWIGFGTLIQFAHLPIQPMQDGVLFHWVFSSVNLLVIIIVLVQLPRQLQETQGFVVTVAKQERELLETREELLRQTTALDYERYLLHTLLNTVSDRIYFKDLSGRYTRISQAVAQVYGVPEYAVLGKTDFDFFELEYAQQVQADEIEMLQKDQVGIDKVERETWRDGRPETWAIKSRLLLKGPDGKVVGWFGTARDITEIKKAHETDQRHAQHLSTVAEVSRAVTSSLDIQDLINTLIELVRQSFNYYGVNVWLLSEQFDWLQLKAGISPEGENLSQAGIQISMAAASSLTLVCKTGVHHKMNNVQDALNFPLIERFPKTRSQLVLPLRVAEKTIGVLDILSNIPTSFSDEDVILLRSLADQVTIAIRNATLYQGEKNRRRLAETLYEVGRALSSTLNLQEVLNLILEQLDEIVPADRAALMLRDDRRNELIGGEKWGAKTGESGEDENVLQIVAYRGFPNPVDSLPLSISTGEHDVFREIGQTKEAISIADVTQRPDWQQVNAIPQARSWLGVPLIRSNEVIGMLSLVREDLNPYTISEVTLAATFAGQAVLALENAALYESVKRFSQHLEEMVASRTEELTQAYDRLERLDRTKSDFIQIVSHELRTPLTVVRGYGQMLQSDPTIQANAALQPLVDGIQNGSIRMQEIVNTMLDIAKIDSSALELSPTPLSLASLCRDVMEKYSTALKARNQTMKLLNLAYLPHIEADAPALYKVFVELLGNAIKYTPDGGQIDISGCNLGPQPDFPEGVVEVIVSDTGIGIAPESRELIFAKFYQTGELALHSTGKTKYKGGGTGLGLPIARGIIQAHQGKLWVESAGYDEEQCPGSQFHILLPVRQNNALSPGDG